MNRLARMAVGVLAALCCTGLSAAQSDHDTGWRTKPVETRDVDRADAARAMRSYAQCVVNRRYPQARAVVLAHVGGAAQRSAISKVVRYDDPCLYGFIENTQMRFDQMILAGVIGEVFTLKEYPDLAMLLATNSIDEGKDQAWTADLPGPELFGRCVARRNPNAVMALFAAAVRSEEEAAAVGSLREDLNACLTAGSTMQINIMFLRNATGIAAYRLGTQLRPAAIVSAR